MKKIIEYKWQLIVGLLIIPITFILLITFMGMFVEIVKYANIHFNLLKYWKNSINNWNIVSTTSLLSLIFYFYYTYKICFARKSEASLKATIKSDYGNARWLRTKEINHLYPLVNISNNYQEHGFVVNSKFNNKHLFHNLRSNTHCLVIGGTGSGKTQGLVLPTINANAHSVVKPSMIVTDIKGELYRSQSKILQEQGYRVQVLNLRNISESIAWNPLQTIYEQFKEMLLKKDKQERLRLKVQIQTDIQDLTKTLFIANNQVDPFWTDSGALIMEAIILGILEKTKILLNKVKSKNDEVTKKLLEKYLPLNHFNLASVTIIAASGKDMIKWFESFPETSIAKLVANQILQNSTKTLASILMTMSTQLAIFKNDFIRNLTCQNDLNFNEFINYPTALFIVIPDENQNYYIFASLLITQLYKFLVTKANLDQNGKLGRPVYFLCDEFGNLPPINNIATMITIARSRNIFFQLIIQDLQQLKERYGLEVANIIFTNCGLHIFLQTMDLATAEKYSNMIGSTTVIKISTNGKGQLKSNSESLASHLLIAPSDLLKLEKDQAIVLCAKENPFKSRMIPWNELNKKNIHGEVLTKKIKLINFEKDYYYDFKKTISRN